jgi:maltooligosyltrehalose trehalohydrolase
MLWMGEEWAASTRWPFFTSHPEKELGEATAKGRLAEFADHGWDVSQMINPQDPEAYRSAVLRWDEAGEDGHAEVLNLYRELVALRKGTPDLADPDLTKVRVDFDEDERWLVIHRGEHRVVANLSAEPRRVPVDSGDVVLATGGVDHDGTQLTIAPESAAVIRLP